MAKPRLPLGKNLPSKLIAKIALAVLTLVSLPNLVEARNSYYQVLTLDQQKKITPIIRGDVTFINGKIITILNGTIAIDASNANIVNGEPFSSIVQGMYIQAAVDLPDSPGKPFPAKSIRITPVNFALVQGVVQKVDRAENSFTILNKKFLVNNQTRFFAGFAGLKDLQEGQPVVAEVQIMGANNIASSVGLNNVSVIGIDGTVSSIDGTVFKVLNDVFAIDLSTANLGGASLSSINIGNFLQAAVNIPDSPDKPYAATGVLLTPSDEASLTGVLQNVDLANKTITVLNQKILITDQTLLDTKRNSLAGLKTGKPVGLLVKLEGTTIKALNLTDRRKLL